MQMNADKSFVLNPRSSAFIGGYQFGGVFQQAIRVVALLCGAVCEIGFTQERPDGSNKVLEPGQADNACISGINCTKVLPAGPSYSRRNSLTNGQPAECRRNTWIS